MTSGVTAASSSEASHKPTRLFHIAVELFLQINDTGERARIAEACDEVNGEGATVQIAAEVDQMDLGLAGVLVEGRVEADIGSVGPTLSPDKDTDSINAVARSKGEQRVEVGGEEAERAAALLAEGDPREGGRAGRGVAPPRSGWR
jgi:hypothetical protein